MNAPLISIVTPVKNGAPWILECLHSVSGLTISYEHIIVYSESSDDTLRLMQSSSYDFTLLHEPLYISSLYQAIDFGLRHSSGQMLAYLNCDDIIYPLEFSRAVLRALANNVDLLIGASKILYVDSGLRSQTHQPSLFARFFLLRGLMPSVQPSFIFSRSVFFSTRFSASLRYAGDLDFFRRIATSNTNSVHVITLCLSCFLSRPDSLGSINANASCSEVISFLGRPHPLYIRVLFFFSRKFSFIRLLCFSPNHIF